MPKDYYDILGLSPAAEADLIEKAYRILALRYHPDRGGGRAEQKHFQRIQQAYEVLANPAQRSLYDQHLLEPPDPRGSGGPGGIDVYQMLPLRLEQAARGGQVRVQHVLDASPRWINVEVPRAVEQGERIRMPGLGEPDPTGGGAVGDLVLIVSLIEHPRLRRRGLDLYTDVDVPLNLAAEGGRAAVPTLDGEAEVDIPAGTRSGHTVRLRAGGLRNSQGQHGDLYAVVHLQPDGAGAFAAATPAGEALEREHRMLEKQREAVRRRIAELDTQRDAAAQRRRRLQGVRSAVRQRRRAIDEQQASLAWQQDALDQQTHQLAEDQQQVERDRHAISADRATLEQNRERMRAEADRLAEQKRTLAGREASVNSQHEQVENQRRQIEQRENELRLEAESLQSQEADLRTREDTLADARTALEQRQRQLDDDRADLERRASEQAKQAAAQQRELDDRVERVSRREAVAEDRENDLARQTETLNVEQKAARQRAEELAAREQTVSEQAEANERAAQRLERDRLDLNQQQQTLSRQQQELAQQRKDLAQRERDTERGVAQLAEREQSLERQREQVEIRRRRAEAEGGEVEQQAQALKQDRAALDRETAEHREAAAALAELRRQVEADQAAVQRDRQELEQQRGRLKAAEAAFADRDAALERQRLWHNRRRARLGRMRRLLTEQVQIHRQAAASDAAEAEQRDQLDVRRRQLEQHQRQLDRQAEQLSQRERAVAEDQQHARQAAERIEAERQALDKRQAALDEQETRLEQQHVAEASRTAELEQRAEQLAQREADAAEQAETLRQNQQQLARQQQEAADLAAALDARQRAIEQQEREDTGQHVKDEPLAEAERYKDDAAGRTEREREGAQLADQQRELEHARQALQREQADLENERAAQAEREQEQQVRSEAAEQHERTLGEKEQTLTQQQASLEARMGKLDERLRELEERERRLSEREAALAEREQAAEAKEQAQQQQRERLRAWQQELVQREQEQPAARPPEHAAGPTASTEPLPHDGDAAAAVSAPPSEDAVAAAQPTEDGRRGGEESARHAPSPTAFALRRVSRQPAFSVEPHHARMAGAMIDRGGGRHLLVDFVDAAQPRPNTWQATIRYYRAAAGGWQWVQTAVAHGSDDEADSYGAASPSIVSVNGRALLFYAGRGPVTGADDANILARPGETGYLPSRIMLATAPAAEDGSPVGPFEKQGVVLELGQAWDSMRLDHPCVVIDDENLHLFYTGYDSGVDLNRRKVGHAVADVGDLVFHRDSDPVLSVPGGGEMPRVFAHAGRWYMFYQHFERRGGSRWRQYVSDDLRNWTLVESQLFDGIRGEHGELIPWIDPTGQLADPMQILAGGVDDDGARKLWEYWLEPIRSEAARDAPQPLAAP